MSGIAVLLWSGLVSMVVNLGQALMKLIKFAQRAWLRHDMQGGLQALTGIAGALLRIVQVAVMIVLMVAGGGYFLPGSGMFGGGGVNVFW